MSETLKLTVCLFFLFHFLLPKSYTFKENLSYSDLTGLVIGYAGIRITSFFSIYYIVSTLMR